MVNRKRQLISVLCVGFVLSLSAMGGEHWNTWRGPDMNGIAEGSKPPVEWSESKNIKWKAEIPGLGMSTPIVWGNKVFILTAVKDSEMKKSTQLPGTSTTSESTLQRRGFGANKPTEVHHFLVMCYDRESGKEVWRRTATSVVPHEGHHRDHSFASFSPVTDGKYLWINYGSRGLYCYDVNGELVWKKETSQMRTRNSFGEGSSPAVTSKAMITVMDHEGDSYIIALDKYSGKELWKKSRDEKTSWTTPIVYEENGEELVVVSGTNASLCYRAKDGEVVWSCKGMTTNVIPTPVMGFGMIYLTSGFRGAALQAITTGNKGDLTGKDAIQWSLDRNTPYVPSPLLYGENLYFFSGNNAILSCVNALNGKEVFERTRIDGMNGVYASPVAANGLVYLTGRRGTVTVIKNGTKYEQVAQNKLDEEFDASPAIAGNQLFLRGKRYLYCIEAKN